MRSSLVALQGPGSSLSGFCSLVLSSYSSNLDGSLCLLSFCNSVIIFSPLGSVVSLVSCTGQAPKVASNTWFPSTSLALTTSSGVGQPQHHSTFCVPAPRAFSSYFEILQEDSRPQTSVPVAHSGHRLSSISSPMEALTSPGSEMREQASLSNIWLKKPGAGMSFVKHTMLLKFKKLNSTSIYAVVVRPWGSRNK